MKYSSFTVSMGTVSTFEMAHPYGTIFEERRTHLVMYI